MKNWTILVFMVPDKRLEDAAWKDLEEMEAAAVPDDVNLAVHIDFEENPQRFVFRGGKVERVDGYRSHDEISASLENFLSWSASPEFQAKQRALILWGHGQGVGTKLSLPARIEVARVRGKRRRLPLVSEVPTSRLPYDIQSTRFASCVLPRRTNNAGNADSRGLERDLDVLDVSHVLERVKESGKKLDILGFDACFMAGIEVASQLQGVADFLVASQDFVPDEGWDYQRFLELIALSGYGEARRVAEAIVGQVRDAGGLTNLTLMDLRNCPKLERLAGALNTHLQLYPADKLRVQLHFESATYLRVRQLIDLRNLCERLFEDFNTTRDPADATVGNAAAALLEQLDPIKGEPFLIRYEAEGDARKLKGVSVFYEHVHAGVKLAADPNPAEMNVVIDPEKYSRLNLVQKGGWGELLRKLSPAVTDDFDKVDAASESARVETDAAAMVSV